MWHALAVRSMARPSHKGSLRRRIAKRVTRDPECRAAAYVNAPRIIQATVNETSTTTDTTTLPRKSRKRGWIITVVVLIAALAAAWQVDLVRQNAQILWLAVTGRAWKLRGQVHRY